MASGGSKSIGNEDKEDANDIENEVKEFLGSDGIENQKRDEIELNEGYENGKLKFEIIN